MENQTKTCFINTINKYMENMVGSVSLYTLREDDHNINTLVILNNWDRIVYTK